VIVSRARCLITHKFECVVCQKTAETAYLCDVGHPMIVPSPPAYWRYDGDLRGNICPDHKVEKVIRIDGRVYWGECH
jgi:hypothetical protein